MDCYFITTKTNNCYTHQVGDQNTYFCDLLQISVNLVVGHHYNLLGDQFYIDSNVYYNINFLNFYEF